MVRGSGGSGPPDQIRVAGNSGEERPAPADREADLGIVFSTFDHDGDGFITAGELEESLKRLGIAVSAAEAAEADAGCGRTNAGRSWAADRRTAA